MKITILLLGFVAMLQITNGQTMGAYKMPYIRYEADAGTFANGAVLLEESYDQALLQSEASEKKCISLTEKDSFVQWAVEQEGRGLTLRFSIPDSENGRGLNGKLGLYINGKKVQDIELTSFFAWQYFDKSKGSDRHPVNTPFTGNPRMRFDEERLLLPFNVKKGDIIKLCKDDDDDINYAVDFIELEPVGPAIQLPDGYIDVTNKKYGAVANDDKDDAKAFEKAIADAYRLNKGLYVPAGKFDLSFQLKLEENDISVQGAGIWYTHLHWTALTDSKGSGGWLGAGSNLYLSDFYMTSNLNNRGGGYRAFSRHWGSNSVIENIWLSHFSVGFWTASSYKKTDTQKTENLTIRNCRIRNTYADGCNLARGASNCVVEHCDFRNNGDDAMASVSHAPDIVGACTNNSYRYNTVEFVTRAGGLGIFGGQKHHMHHCIIRDCFAGAGIRVNSVFPAFPFVDSSYITISDMLVERCGTSYGLWNNNIAAVNITTQRFDVQNVIFKDITVKDSQTDAIYINRSGNDATIRNIIFKDIVIDGTGKDENGKGDGIFITRKNTGWAKVSDIYFRNIKSEEIRNDSPQFKIK